MATYTNGTVIGVFEGTTLAAAFTNPSSQDIIQIVNASGKVVYNLTSTGVNHTNPATSTLDALYQQCGAASLALAYTNPGNLDLLQVINDGGGQVFHVDHLGNASTP